MIASLLGGKNMKLTQTIKNWLLKMFAWWPWKQSTQIEYPHVANPQNKGTPQETLSRSMIDGIAPQAGIVPRLSTVEEWPERVVQSDPPAANEFTDPPSLSSKPTGDGEPMKESPSPGDGTVAVTQTSPSPQQRLEFLHYLIKRGIVNEGFEEDR
jgi:hypothetical protein